LKYKVAPKNVPPGGKSNFYAIFCYFALKFYRHIEGRDCHTLPKLHEKIFKGSKVIGYLRNVVLELKLTEREMVNIIRCFTGKLATQDAIFFEHTVSGVKISILNVSQVYYVTK